MSANWIFEGKCRRGPRHGQWMSAINPTVTVPLPLRPAVCGPAGWVIDVTVRTGTYRWVDGVWEWHA